MAVTNISISGQLIALENMDFSQPIILTVTIDAPNACYDFEKDPQYLPSYQLLKTDGTVLKSWAGSSSNPFLVSINEDIRPVVQGLAEVMVQYVTPGCSLTATDYSSQVAANLISYTSIQSSFPNLQTLAIEGIGPDICSVPQGFTYSANFDLGLWDGKSPVTIKFIADISDGFINILINGQRIARFDSTLNQSDQFDLDITAYVKQGLNTFTANWANYHGEPSCLPMQVEQIEITFNAATQIPKLNATGSVNCQLVKTVKGDASNVSGDITVFTDIPIHLQVDTKGLLSPSLVDIPDASQETQIKININKQGDFSTFAFDFYIIVNGISYFLETLNFTSEVTTEDLRPVVSIINQQEYLEVSGANLVGTIRTTVEIDNSKYGQAITATIATNYFGQSSENINVPANSIMIFSFDHGFIGSTAAVQSTGGGTSVSIPNSPGATADWPDTAFPFQQIQGNPPPLPAPSVTAVGGGTNPVVATPTPKSSPIVLSTDEKIAIGGGVAAAALLLTAWAIGRGKKT